MSLLTATLLVIALLLLLIMARVPIAFALLAAGAVGLFLLDGPAVTSSLLGRQPFQLAGQYSLIIVPLFILMGMLARQGRIADDAFALAARLTRRIPGGLAIASIAACAGFAAVSGSSVATVASVGRISTQEMRRHGYDKRLAVGVVGAAGTLGVLIPPSVVLVLYGIVTRESIGHLLIAGIIPGVLSAVLYAIAIVVRVKRRPELAGGASRLPVGDQPPRAGSGLPLEATAPPHPSGPAKPGAQPLRRTGGIGVAQILVIFAVVIGGIYTGVFTATESAALGALVTLLMVAFDRGAGHGGWRQRLTPAIKDTVEVTSMAFALVIGAGIFTHFLVLAGVPTALTSWLTDIDAPAWMIIVLILLVFVPLGMMLDPLSILLIVVPLMHPVVTALGFDGIWFGIMVVKMIELGMITPPVGINVFLVAGTTPDCSVEDAFRGITPFFLVDAITVAMLVAFPVIVTWLPMVMRG